jgi:hypothetical protein
MLIARASTAGAVRSTSGFGVKNLRRPGHGFQAMLLASVVLFSGTVALGDTVYLRGRNPGAVLTIRDVTISNINKAGDAEVLVYSSNASGRVISRPLESVERIEAEGESLFTQAETEFAKGDLKAAEADYRAAAAKAQKRWVKRRIELRLLSIAGPAASDVPATPPPALPPAPATSTATNPVDPRAIRIVNSLREVQTNPQLTAGQKLQAVREASENVDVLLAALNQPQEIIEIAGQITEVGVKPEVNRLEYWGEDALAQARLKPMSSAVIRLLDAAEKRAVVIGNELARHDLKNNPRLADEWEKTDSLANTAAYSKNMAVYADCLATGFDVFIDARTKKVLTPSEIGEAKKQKEPIVNLRQSMARGAIENLKEFDNPDSGVQARIRNMSAKLSLASDKFRNAKDTFASVYAEKTLIFPRPTPFEQYDARYFAVVADVLSGDRNAAIQSKLALDAWQPTLHLMLVKQGVPENSVKEIEKSADVAGEVLAWRIARLSGALLNNPAQKKAADEAAEAVLVKLRASAPELTPRINQQIALLHPGQERNVDADSPADAVMIGLAAPIRAQPARTSDGGGIGPNGPVFTNGVNARRIVFVMDASGSMINKMPTLMNQLTKAIVGLRPIQSFELIFFHDEKIDSFSKFSHQDGLVPATPDAKRNASKFFEGITAHGTTEPIPGIIAAFKANPQVMYLLTDGDFPDNAAVLKTIRDLNQARPPNERVKINTIAFVGDGDNEVAFLDLLKTIAKESGGTFRHVKEADLN